MNDINFDFKRYRELLKLRNEVLNANKSFFKYHHSDCLELNRYNTIISDSILWNERSKLASLVEDYLNKKIDVNDFKNVIFEFRHNYIKKCNFFITKLLLEEIKDFSLDTDGSQLQSFLSSLYFECEGLEPDFDEENFYHLIKNLFLKYENLLS